MTPPFRTSSWPQAKSPAQISDHSSTTTGAFRSPTARPTRALRAVSPRFPLHPVRPCVIPELSRAQTSLESVTQMTTPESAQHGPWRGPIQCRRYRSEEHRMKRPRYIAIALGLMFMIAGAFALPSTAGASPGSILIFGPTLNGFPSNEESLAQAAGFTV